MVKGHRKERHSRNILKKIERGFGGPIDMLKVYMTDRKRVKIYTRKEHGILGYITGFIESFDKHWNIVLSDVYEVWKRKKIHFCDTANYGMFFRYLITSSFYKDLTFSFRPARRLLAEIKTIKNSISQSGC